MSTMTDEQQQNSNNTSTSAVDLQENPKKKKKNMHMLRLKSSDGVLFEVEDEVAFQSKLIQCMAEVDGEINAEVVIPIPTVDAECLTRVIEYCRHRVDQERWTSSPQSKSSSGSIEAGETWEERFVKEMTMGSKDTASASSSMATSSSRSSTLLFDMVMAANYLNIGGLLELTSGAVADRMKEMSYEQVRSWFGIVSDLTPEEEQDIIRENSWAFE